MDGRTEREEFAQLTTSLTSMLTNLCRVVLGLQPDRTVLVELGALRPFSDVLGRHAIRMEDSSQCRHDLADRLKGAGCAVDLNGRDWHAADRKSTRLNSSHL